MGRREGERDCEVEAPGEIQSSSPGESDVKLQVCCLVGQHLLFVSMHSLHLCK